MKKFYQFAHGTQITVTIPTGVPAWKSPQREGLTLTVCHPQGWINVSEDHELIEAKWFDGSVVHHVRIRVEWITDRESFRQSESTEGEKAVVKFPASFAGSEMSVYQWVISISRNPKEWSVYRDGAQLEYWTDRVKRGQFVVLKPVDQG